ncbi:MAG: autotransporter domain-containing protein, partial [Sphingomonadales bacterium]|nr:autotransporter domain-containing protein [Sphingomonadales bacterium]
SVESGAVAVNANLTAPVTLGTGGVLNGTGTVVGNVTNNGGNMAPGNSIGTLNITGNYIQSAAGTLTIETNGIASDALNISGTATLDGVLKIDLTLGQDEIQLGGNLTFLTAAGGITGTFAGIDYSSQNFVVYTMANTGTSLVLQAQRSSFLQPFYSTQQTAVASVLNSVKSGAGTAGVFVKDLTFSYRGIAGRMMDQLVSDAAPNMVTPAFKARHSFMESVTDRATALLDQPSITGRWSANVAGFGQFGEAGASADSFDYSTGGASAMALYGVDENTAIGFAMGASSTTMDMSTQGGGNDRTGLDVAGFATWNKNAIKLSAMAGVSYDAFETTRSIVSQNINATARGQNNAVGLTAAINARYDGEVFGVDVRPEAGLRAMNLTTKAYDETGVDNLGLSFESNGISSIRPHAGVNLSKSFKMDNGWHVRPMLSASYEREMGDRSRSLDAAFIAAPDDIFTINGVAADRSTTRLKAGVVANLSKGMSFRMGYEGSFGDQHKVHGLSINFQTRW